MTFEIQYQAKLSQMESCPICRSKNLRLNLWSAEVGEIEAVECGDCGCMAPVSAWNNGRDGLANVKPEVSQDKVSHDG
jgi:Zn ribbon nucleic-acid-binding protein